MWKVPFLPARIRQADGGAVRAAGYAAPPDSGGPGTGASGQRLASQAETSRALSSALRRGQVMQ
jgi:hypothetical protein